MIDVRIALDVPVLVAPSDLKRYRAHLRRQGARIAKDRLCAVIAADRAPRGEWVKRGLMIDWQPWVPEHVRRSWIPPSMERVRTICRWRWL